MILPGIQPQTPSDDNGENGADPRQEQGGANVAQDELRDRLVIQIGVPHIPFEKGGDVAEELDMEGLVQAVFLCQSVYQLLGGIVEAGHDPGGIAGSQFDDGEIEKHHKGYDGKGHQNAFKQIFFHLKKRASLSPL